MKSLRKKPSKRQETKPAKAPQTPQIGILDRDLLLNLVQTVEDTLAEARDYLIDSGGANAPTEEYILAGLAGVRSAMLTLDEIRTGAIGGVNAKAEVAS